MSCELGEGAAAGATAADPKVIEVTGSMVPSNNNPSSLPANSSNAVNDESEVVEPASKLGIDGADLLERLLAFYKRFVRLPSESGEIAVVLWAAHAHLMDAWETTPRLAFLSAEPGSGKSRAMEVVALFTPRSLEAANVTTASLIRAMEDPAGIPTYFIDEIDTKYGANGKGDEDLRGFVNSGHGRGGSSLRCEPTAAGGWIPKKISSYAAVAMAGIGNLPDTILARSVILRMRKRAPGEFMEPYRQRDHKALGHALRDELEAWARAVLDQATGLRPSLPNSITDRNADVWEPLIAVADLAGGRWPARARAAAVEMVQAAKDTEAPSLGVQLLSDVRRCFQSDDKLATEDILERLLCDNEAPWGELKGKQIDARKLAAMLKPYGVKSGTVRLSDTLTPKGYKREDFYDAWRRYLAAPVMDATSATTATEIGNQSGDCPMTDTDLPTQILEQ